VGAAKLEDGFVNTGEVFMANGWFLIPFFGLAVAQAIFYQVSQKEALRHFWFLGFFYFFLFAFVRGITVFAQVFSYPYCEFPIFFLATLILFGKTSQLFPPFGASRRPKIDFYFFSAIWMGIAWFFFIFNLEPGFFGTQPETYVRAFLWSFFPAAIFPVLLGIKERLALLDPPKAFQGTPIFLIASGIFFLATVFFWSFIN
jgi:hypothetical protein